LPFGEYEGCCFLKCDFSSGDLSGFIFVDCEFSGCNLSLAKLAKTAFRDIQIKDCKMLGLLMPKGAAGDEFHLACASFHKIDYLLTWNCNHLANANKEKHIRVVNTKLGLFTPVIVTPIQLFKEEDT
jgi:uncharacterized protein YjbI with pentapeptide repeats